jgi:endoglucanase
MRLRFKLVNNGSEPILLNEVTLRYWFTREECLPNVREQWLISVCEWAGLLEPTSQDQCGLVSHQLTPVPPVTGADHYLEVGFLTSAADVLEPGASTGELKFLVYKDGWNMFEESDDHSWVDAYSGFLPNPNITV